MTLTRRKVATREENANDSGQPQVIAIESSNTYRCDLCTTDITKNVRAKCAETIKSSTTATEILTCPDFDLCIPCFISAQSLGPHKANHAYRIISSHAFPIFAPDWGADEELLLIEGAELYGLGNWADMAEYVGGRTKEECEKHYNEIYLNSSEYPLPVTKLDFGISQDTFQARKKRRLEEVQARPLVLPPPKPMASAPTCHEIAGFMPGRLEYETEYENDAESLVKDMEFGKVYAFGGELQPAAVEEVAKEVKEEGEEKDDAIVEEDEGELQLKLAVLEMFNERYDKRMAAKEVIFDRGLMNYKTILVNERKRTKEERDLVNRAKVFAKIQTAQDHEDLVDGLLHEMALKRRIAELQEYRTMGLTTIAESEKYERDKSQRTAAKLNGFRESMGYERPTTARARPPISSVTKIITVPRPSTSILTLATSSSLNLLTSIEKELCSTLRILPRPYLFLKETLIREWIRSEGVLNKEGVRKIVGIKDNLEGMGVSSTEWAEKIDRVWDFLRENGGLKKIEKPKVVEEVVVPVVEDGMEIDGTGIVSSEATTVVDESGVEA